MSNDSQLSRRSFLKSGVTSAAGLAAASSVAFITQPERVFGANDRVRVAVCGVHGRGVSHLEGYSKLENVEVAAVCDVDENVLAQRVAEMVKQGIPKPATFVDVRKVLEDKSIDAISIATPNHWHCLMGIWACQAGKDVYVEKPCSHNWWEGRQLVRAGQKYNRMVQHGTQSRSAPSALEAIQKIHDGLIGDVYLARGLCYKWRNTIGHASAESVPAGVHYDLWTGPAPLRPFTQNRFHYKWHWFWDFGNGDLGNQGVHQLDVARWGLGVKFPNKVSALGGHFMFDDDQETPNTLNCAFQFDLPDGKRKMMEFEVRHWITDREAEIGGVEMGGSKGDSNCYGDLFLGSKGYLAVGNEDMRNPYLTWLGREQTPGPSRGPEEGQHFANFIDCVRSRKREDLHAPIEEGHISATLMHLANASYRLGRTLNFDPETEQVIGDEEANHLLRDAGRGYRAPFTVPEEV
ncbi:MAG: Gfo/Idh/MocA family protein [Terriglobia bacterium]